MSILDPLGLFTPPGSANPSSSSSFLDPLGLFSPTPTPAPQKIGNLPATLGAPALGDDEEERKKEEARRMKRERDERMLAMGALPTSEIGTLGDGRLDLASEKKLYGDDRGYDGGAGGAFGRTGRDLAAGLIGDVPAMIAGMRETERGAGAYAANLLGMENVAGYLGAERDQAAEMRRTLTTGANELSRPDTDKGFFEAIGSGDAGAVAEIVRGGVARSLPTTLAAAAAGPASLTGAARMVAPAIMEAGTAFGEARDAGVGDLGALAGAGVQGALGGYLETKGLDRIFSDEAALKGAFDLFRSAGKAALTEAGTEALQGGVGYGREAAQGTNDRSWTGLAETMAQGATIGAVSGGGIKTVGHLSSLASVADLSDSFAGIEDGFNAPPVGQEDPRYNEFIEVLATEAQRSQKRAVQEYLGAWQPVQAQVDAELAAIPQRAELRAAAVQQVLDTAEAARLVQGLGNGGTAQVVGPESWSVNRSDDGAGFNQLGAALAGVQDRSLNGKVRSQIHAMVPFLSADIVDDIASGTLSGPQVQEAIAAEESRQIRAKYNKLYKQLALESGSLVAADMADATADAVTPTTPAPRPPLDPNENVRDLARDYARRRGMDSALGEGQYLSLLEDRSKEIADLYERMEHEPHNPQVRESYDAFKQETREQWEFLQSRGVVFEVWEGEGQPYADSAAMTADIRDNNHLYFFPTDLGFGSGDSTAVDHPLLEGAGIQLGGRELVYNDIFRAVHDFFGHAAEGYQFGPRGEENAWGKHARMYTPVARRAMTAETRGQNSWVNFGGHLRRPDGSLPKKGDPDFVPADQRPYAPQKAGLLPERFSLTDEELADQIADRALDAQLAHGGVTFNAQRGNLANSDSWVVSTRPDRGEVIEGDPTRDQMRSFARKNWDLLQGGQFNLGGWKDGDKTYLDLSELAPDRDAAISLGREHKQKAVGKLIPGGFQEELVVTVETSPDRSYRGTQLFSEKPEQARQYVARNVDGEEVGYLLAHADPDGGFRVKNVQIEKGSRGKGVAEQLYLKAYEDLGTYIGPTDHLSRRTDDGQRMHRRLLKSIPQVFGDPYAAAAAKSGEMLELEHYSFKSGLDTLDPQFHGTGKTGQERRRKLNYSTLFVPRLYAYSPGAVPEDGLGPHKYKIKIPASAVYDINTDVLGFAKEIGARKDHNGLPIPEAEFLTLVERAVAEAGYEALSYKRENTKQREYLVFKPQVTVHSRLAAATSQVIEATREPDVTPEKLAAELVSMGLEEKGVAGTIALLKARAEAGGVPFEEFVKDYFATPRRGTEQDLSGGELAQKRKVREMPVGWGRLRKHLLPEERENVRQDVAKRMVAMFSSHHAGEVMEAAVAGRIARRWYHVSAATLSDVFGGDAPRFIGVLAAQSPRQTVSENLRMAARTWAAWNDAGRPADPDVLREMLFRIPGATLPARVPNVVNVLSSPDDRVWLSGEKVDSFAANLVGEYDRVTNDTWQAQFFGIEAGGLKGARYLALSAATRRAAAKLGWSPAEAQAAIWTFTRTLKGLMRKPKPGEPDYSPQASARTPKQALSILSDDMMRATQDSFADLLLNDKEVAYELTRSGIDVAGQLATGQRGPAARLEAGTLEGGLQSADPRILSRIAERLAGFGAPVLEQRDGEDTLGTVEFIEDGRAIIRAFEGADVSTLVHEVGHVFRRTLPPADLAIAAKWAGAKVGEAWSVPAEENFARGFERYLAEGAAPTEGLRKVFSDFASWLGKIYRNIRGIPGIDLSDDMRALFGRMLTPGQMAIGDATQAGGVEALAQTRQPAPPDIPGDNEIDVYLREPLKGRFSGREFLAKVWHGYQRHMINDQDPIRRKARELRKVGAEGKAAGKFLYEVFKIKREKVEVARSPINRGTHLRNAVTGQPEYTGVSLEEVIGGLDAETMTDLSRLMLSESQIETNSRRAEQVASFKAAQNTWQAQRDELREAMKVGDLKLVQFLQKTMPAKPSRANFLKAAKLDLKATLSPEEQDALDASETATDDAEAQLDRLQKKWGDRFPELLAYAEGVRQWSIRANLDVLVAAGRISEEKKAEIVNGQQKYAPFLRLLEEDLKDDLQPYAKLNKDTLAKRTGDISAGVINPLVGFIIKAQQVQKWAADQYAINGLADVAEKFPGVFAGEVDFVEKQGPPRGLDPATEVKAWKNGEARTLRLDKEMMLAVKDMNPALQHWFFKMLSSFAKVKRIGATLTPGFLSRNPAKDQFAAGINSDWGYVPVYHLGVGLVAMLANAHPALRRIAPQLADLAKEAYIAGGMTSGLMAVDMKGANVTLDSLVRAKTGTSRAIKAARARFREDGLLFPLQMAGNALEQGTRVGAYVNARRGPDLLDRGLAKFGVSSRPMRKATVREAAVEMREISIDFNQMGTTGRFWNAAEEFVNPMLQDGEKVRSNFQRHPARTFAKAFAYITIPALMNLFLRRDDDEYDNLHEVDKLMFYHPMKFESGGYLRFPRPVGIMNVIFGWVPQKMIEYARGVDPEAASHALGALLDQTALAYADGPSGIQRLAPAALQPAVDVAVNKDWRGMPIENEYQRREHLDKTAIGRETTGPVGVGIAQGAGVAAEAMGFKPIVSAPQVEALITGYGAGLGKLALEGADAALGTTQPLAYANDPNYIARFLGWKSARPIGFGSKPVSDFYELANAATGALNTIEEHEDNDRGEKALRHSQLYPEWEYAKDLARVRSEINEMRKKRFLIQNDQTISEEQRYIELLEIDQMVTQRALAITSEVQQDMKARGKSGGH